MQSPMPMGGGGATPGMPLPWGKAPSFTHEALERMFEQYMSHVNAMTQMIMQQSMGSMGGAQFPGAPPQHAAPVTPGGGTPPVQAQPASQRAAADTRKSMPPQRAPPRAPGAGKPMAVSAGAAEQPKAAPAKPAANESHMREGWLLEKRKKGLQKWQKKYFVLRDEWIYHYPKEPRSKDVKPTEVVGLWGYSIGRQHDNHNPILVLSHPTSKDFYLQAESPFDLEQWMNAILAAINSLPEKRPSGVTHTPFGDVIVDATPEQKEQEKPREPKESTTRKLHSTATNALKSITDRTSMRQKSQSGRGAQSKSAASPMFGVLLQDIVNLEDGVPVIVKSAIECLRAHTSLMGIFRKSGSALVIQDLKKKFDKGETVDLTTVDDPHAVAGLLKLFFREMPEPLLPFECYEQFEEAAKRIDEPNADTRREMIRDIIQSLPQINRDVLGMLMNFLGEVQQHESENKMSSQNLAIVFSPNILRKKDATMIEAMMQSKVGNLIVCNMVEWNQDFFPQGTYYGAGRRALHAV